MNIAVIGNYTSPKYQEFLKIVKLAKPEEVIIDLSRHPGENWMKKCGARFEDINESHMVVIHPDYLDFHDSRRDVTYAMERKRECLIFIDGRFLPYPEYAPKL